MKARRPVAGERRLISKRDRFEALKRDRFKCQYCGATAPDVLLHIDHIVPVAKGGDSSMTNLVTACQGCNSGKGATPLENRDRLQMARASLEEQEARREQLELMAQWLDDLRAYKDRAAEIVAAYWYKLTPGGTLNKAGLQSLAGLLRRFTVEEVVEAMDVAAERYLRWEDKSPTHKSCEEAWDKIGGVAYNRRKQGEAGR